MRRSLRGLWIAASLSASACGGDAPPAVPAVAQPRALEAIAKALIEARAAKDSKRISELGFSMTPTTAELMSCLKAGPESDAFLAAYKAKDLKDGEKEVAALGASLFLPVDPKRTEVHAYAATTEDLMTGTPSYGEFPGGMRRFAEKIAAPGRIWYVVEIVEPGHDSGTKYTCFTKVNGRFIVVVKPWRVLPRDPESKDEMGSGSPSGD